MTTRYQRHASVRVTALNDGGVALHLDTHRYFTINATGLTLLEVLTAALTLEELGATLAAQYDVGVPEAVATARTFIEQCLERGVVVPTDP